MGKKKNQRKNSVKVPSYKNTEEMLLSSELADIFGLEAGHTASVDQSIKLLWLYIKVLERRYDHRDYGHTMARSLILCCPNSNTNPK